MEKSELILGMMAGHLTADQQEKLKQVLNIALTENSQCTALITADDNMYMLQKYCVELKVQQKSERTVNLPAQASGYGRGFCLMAHHYG